LSCGQLEDSWPTKKPTRHGFREMKTNDPTIMAARSPGEFRLYGFDGDADGHHGHDVSYVGGVDGAGPFGNGDHGRSR
jgi:hypothetical protein